MSTAIAKAVTELNEAKLEAAIALYRFRLERFERWTKETGFNWLSPESCADALRHSADKYGVPPATLRAALNKTS